MIDNALSLLGIFIVFATLMIIDRYITKEIAYTFLAATGVLLFIALCNNFISLLAKAAMGQIPGYLVFKIIFLYIPEFLSLLSPLGLFVAILFTHSRLHTDSEMSVLFTSGVGWMQLVKITLKLALIIAMMILVFTTLIIPRVIENREMVFAKSKNVGILNAVIPGQFQMLDSGRLVFYVEDLSTDRELVKVFIAEQPQEKSLDKILSVLTANGGFIDKTKSSNEFFLVLKNGHRYTGIPGMVDYKVIDFEEYGKEVDFGVPTVSDFAKIMPTTKLFVSDKSTEKAELQWRFSLPLSVLVLALLAISLAKVQPRQGRFAKFLPAILLYIAYFNLMTIVRRKIAEGILSPYYSLWCVHLVFLIVGLILLAKVSGRLLQFWREYKNKRILLS